MGRTRLRSVKLDEISFVGKGDNPEAHVLLLKMKKDPSVSFVKLGKEYKNQELYNSLLKTWLADNSQLVTKEDGEACTFDDIMQDKALREQVWNLCWTLEDSLSSIIHDDTVADKTAMIQQSIDQFKAAITAITKGEPDMPELKKAKEDLAKAQETIAALEKEKGVLTEEVTSLKAACSDKDKKMDEMKKSSEEDPIFKGMPDAAVALIKEQRADIEKMKDENLTREYIGKAAAVDLIGPAAEIGPLLKTIAKHDSGSADKVFELFKTAQTRIAEGDLLKEKGTSGETSGNTALDMLNKKAEEYVKEHPEVSKAKAFTIVYDTEHDLRKQYIEETRKR